MKNAKTFTFEFFIVLHQNKSAERGRERGDDDAERYEEEEIYGVLESLECHSSLQCLGHSSTLKIAYKYHFLPKFYGTLFCINL